MSQNVGIAGTSESVIDATVTEVDIRITTDVTLVTAAIQIFCLCQVFCRAVTRIDGRRSVQVHGAAEGRIEVVFLMIELTMFVEHITRFSHHTLLTATKNLEGVAVVVVYGGAAPYLGFLTIASTKDGHGQRVQIVALVFKLHSGIARGENLVFLDYVLEDVDDDVAVHVAAVVTAAVDVATQ